MRFKKITPMRLMIVGILIFMGMSSHAQFRRGFFAHPPKTTTYEARNLNSTLTDEDIRFKVFLTPSSYLITVVARDPIDTFWTVEILDSTGHARAVTDVNGDKDTIYFDTRLLGTGVFIIRIVMGDYLQQNAIYLE